MLTGSRAWRNRLRPGLWSPGVAAAKGRGGKRGLRIVTRTGRAGMAISTAQPTSHVECVAGQEVEDQEEEGVLVGGRDDKLLLLPEQEIGLHMGS